MVRKWGGRYRGRSVTLSRKPTQPNRGGGSGCYPRVHGEKLWRFGGKSGGPSTGGFLGTFSRSWVASGPWFRRKRQDGNHRGGEG